ncbi:MAG TPA: hypothetical protein VN903_31610 [Polyangia bacterium]|nr:hypothetical protein [Polyangia bacterium]
MASLFEAQAEQIDAGTTKLRVRWNGAAVSARAALELCRDDESFRSDLIRNLASPSFAAYFWEMPPVSASLADRPFEFVLTEASMLARAAPEADAFQEYFARDDDGDGVVAFANLGGDATLVVPCPLASTAAYVHLAAFLRGAPAPQAHALFKRVAHEALARISDRPLWISTAGMGIYWLHVRLDSRPKYYRHTPYTTRPR